jgi:anti-sigma factor RsiW
MTDQENHQGIDPGIGRGGERRVDRRTDPGIDHELDPLRDRMVAALYGELPPEDEEELLTHLASDPALRAEWDELQESRGFLGAADAADPDPGFVFELPAAARVGGAAPGVHDRLRGWLTGLLVRPAAGFALAVAACVVLLIAGLRIDRVPSGLAVHFGPAAPAGTALLPVGSAPGGTEQPGDALGGPVAGIEPGAGRSADDLDLNTPVTRAELAAFAQELVSATETRLQQQEDRSLGQTVYMLRDYHRAVEEERQRDRREITADMNRALLALLQAGAVDGERLEAPRGQAAGDSTPVAAPRTQTEEGVRHE